MPRKEWTTDFDGLKIQFVNQWSFFGACTEQVFIDGKLMSEVSLHAAKDSFKDAVFGRHVIEVSHRDRVHMIEIQAGSKWPGLFMGCHIFVDGNLVGGDVSSRLMFKSSKQR